jgi:alkylation response protein AidB-like acyl-CoA dehydrogenase
MDFRFDDEQLALRDAIAMLCKDHADLTDMAARENGATSRDAWNALVAMGVFGLLVPEDAGGFGGGAVEAALVFEQLGAYLVAGPLLWSTITAPLVPEVVTGAVRVTGVDGSDATAGAVVIADVAASDVVVIVRDDRLERCPVAELHDGIEGEPFDPLTPATQFAAVPAGEVIGDADDVHRLRLVGTVLAAASLVGVAQGALDVAKEYALQRKQFGVPIGSFQAIKHLLADCYVRTELARSATYAAAAMIGGASGDDARKAVSTAKLLAGEAGIANGRTAVQVLGGMGFTWEMLPHYYLKRAWVLEESFGTGDAHALALSDALGSEVSEVAPWT